MHYFVLTFVAIFVVACSDVESTKPRASNVLGQSSSSSGSTASGVGGAGGEAGGSGGTAGSGGQDDLDAGLPVPTEAGAADPPCTNDYAYWALGMSFVAPTLQPLALALSELAYDQSAHPISVVLAAKGGVASATLGISATTDNGMGLQVFPAGTKPNFVPAFLSFGSFQSGAPQSSGTLRLVDAVGPVDIELNNITVQVTTSSSCSNMVAVLNAEIPPSEGSKTLHLKAGNVTIGELASTGGGGKDAGPLSIFVRAFFAGETMSFDFSTLN